MKLYTTFVLLKDSGACTDRYKHLAKALGGIKKYGEAKPISFLNILKHNGLDDCLWALRATPEQQGALRDRFSHTLTRRYALAVIHLWDAPDVVRRYLETGDESIRDAARAAARDAAWAAAWAATRDAAWAAARAAARDAARAAARAAAGDAAWDAAGDAAWDAAGDQHRKLQAKIFRELYTNLNGGAYNKEVEG